CRRETVGGPASLSPRSAMPEQADPPPADLHAPARPARACPTCTRAEPDGMSYRYRHISFLSDYGSTDEFAGVCRGVILRIAPEATVIDVTHGIRPQDVHEGALMLARSVRYLPVGVHLAVVDPAVGSRRLPVPVAAADGSVLVGPDNGLLL